MIRLIVRATNSGAASNIGGPVDVWYRTFDVELPDVETYLKIPANDPYTSKEVIGVEVLNLPPAAIGD